MSFIADKQTLDDLSLLGKYNPHSVFSLFNQVKTRGAEKLLEAMFQQPLTDAGQINTRSAIFQYFTQHPAEFPFEDAALDKMEAYVEEGADSNRLLSFLHVGRKKIAGMLLRDEAFQQEQERISSTMAVLQVCKTLLVQIENNGWDKNSPWEKWVVVVRNVVQDSRLQGLTSGDISFSQMVKLHHLLTGVFREQLKNMLALTYELDLYIAVARVARDSGFSYGVALPKSHNTIAAEEIRHPGLAKAVGNQLTFSGASNVLFLTGANMAGKSTLMKSAGIMVYLAHMGFPVAAKNLRFSVLDGIYSSVNVPDDINKGYSHFYAEVLRVKTVAEEVAAGKSLFIIFDELFKGTNVKDAYDATLSVTSAFTSFRDCFFIISTHIFEVGHELMKAGDQIQFRFLPTVMKAHVPTYTYRLETGITTDRQGMIIIENEGILQML
ncbi:DNA mismatch repair protein [Chitinophaga sp. sic0106]|uniref:MutS-related protein n=1 Tax=Chitinophaga sp. sic0106 TaxID=2854785 RepID=UPI001C47EFE5|nr:DNA mismatch repair protein [Chitinophaga sp. sic0106]MBV7530933.1 DNA mismatch repair protein [Chitinophaga sp. sic0106]